MKLFRIVFIVSFLMTTNAHSGFYEADYLEPIFIGSVTGYIGYKGAKSGDEFLMGSLYFAGGYYLGTLINGYARTKVDNHMDRKIKVYDVKLQEIDNIYAEKAYNGEGGVYYSNEVESLEPGQSTGRGGVISPTKMIRLEGN